MADKKPTQDGHPGSTTRETHVYTCEFCGTPITGCGYFRHVRLCERRPSGATKKLYPVELPRDVHRRFHAKCVDLGQTLAERVWMLIEHDIDELNRPDGDL